MGASRWPVSRLIEEVRLLAGRGLPRERYYGELAARLRRVVDCDATCWHTLDPQTRLMTSDAPHELVERGVFTADAASAAAERLATSEYLVEDVNTFAALASRRVPVGIPFELRAAFVTRGRAWGAVHVARCDGGRDFTRADAEALALVAGPIADGVRASLRLDAARRHVDAAAPGLVVLGPSNDVELITAPARELLDAMRSPGLGGSDETPPAPLLALASFARRRAGEADGPPDVVAVPSACGWVTLHASLPEGHGDGRVAIVLERSGTEQATAVRLEAHGVSPREREIAVLLARGLSNPEIAAALVLSPYTVQDHVKSLFEKTNVSSRRELVARLFLDDYHPRIARSAPLAATGAFAEPSPAAA
jgi:DNA-binding CsgD family transcriptional regulator